MILFNYFVLSCFGSINLLAGSSQTNPTQVLPSEQHAFLKKTAENIGRALDELGEDELVTLKTQKIYNIAEYIPRNFDEETQLKKISNRIAKKIESVLVPLRQTSIEIYDFMMNIPEKLQFDQACVMKVKILIDPNLPVFVSARHLNLTKVFKQNYNRNPSIKFQYFIPSADYGEMTHVYEPAAIDECYKSDDPSYQNTYLRTIEKKPKRIILMIDVGSSLSMNQLDTAKRVARHIISSLSDVDRVGLIAVNANVTTIFNDFCKQNTMVQATSGSKRLMMKFIDFLGISRAATNHTIGFQIAFSLLNGTWLHGDGEDATIVYVSKGLLSPLNELKPLLNVIAQGQQTVSPRVVINTCLLVDDEKPLLFDKILREVAEQNFTKHNISFDVSRKNMSFTGVMESVSSDTNVDSIVRRLITSNYSKNVDEFTFSLPKWDGNSLTMSVSTKIKLNTGLLGVIGLDVYLEDITEDIVYYHQNSRSYAFLIDTNGHVMMHPYLKQSRYSDVQASDKSTVVIDIKNFELDDGFDAVKNEMLMSPKGSVKVERQSSKGRKKIQYAWQKVYNLPFIVVVVSDLSKKPLGVYNSNTTIQGSNLVHHLYYLVNSKPLHPRNKTDEQNICSYMNQLTFFNASSLFLSAWVFQSPFRYLSAPESNVRTYSAYLNDVTKPFADHGFRDDGIQYDILALMRVLEEWEKNILKSKLSKYVVRKYVATSSGLLVVFPGSVIEHNLDPVRRSWFSRAVKNPEKIILSSPYLDAGWAGYIVTYSQKLVYHLKASSVTPTSVVMAMDLTLGYFYTLLLDNLPFCTLNDIRNIASEGKIKCFLMDDKGYILSHPNSLESSKLKKSKIPNEGLHITHKSYPLVASDILNHEGFVKKLLCTDYSTNTIQRYYKFNTSLTDVLINKISGEQCVRYQIVSIPGTNVFLGVVNTTCQPTAFCPCSTLDRQCMNCNRMAQTDCECPCECSLDVDVCLSYNHSKGSNHSHQKPTPPCPNYAEPFTPGYKPSYYYSLLAKVKPCTNYECKRFTNYKDCMGTAGCEWCTTDQDGVTPLRNPECTVQAICFNGIRNSYFPYGNIIGQGYGSWMNADTGSTSNSMLMILVLFAIIFSLGLMSYCYVNRTQMNQIDSAQQLSLYTADKRYKKFSEEPSTDHNNVLLQSGMQEVVQDAATAAAAAASQSPYSSNSSSRLVTVCAPRRNPAPTPPPPPRPPRSESDDHGYSTMASTTNDDAFTSFFSPSPSPPHHHLATTAVLLSPHQFCVPVIVHRVQDNHETSTNDHLPKATTS